MNGNKKILIDIVVPNYNGRHLLSRFFDGVFSFSNSLKCVKDIIVIDDCSTDDSYEFIRKYFPVVKLIKINKNIGFAKALNCGFEYASAPFVFALNTDVEINEKTFSIEHIQYLSDNRVFAISPQIRYPTGELCSPHLLFPEWINGSLHMGKHLEPLNEDIPKCTFWVSAGSSIFNREKYIQLKGLRDIFHPFYSEDVDLCWRAWNKSWKSLWINYGYVIHHRDGVINNNFDHMYIDHIKSRNKHILTWLNCPIKDLFKHHILYIVFDKSRRKSLISALRYIPTVIKERIKNPPVFGVEYLRNIITKKWKNNSLKVK